MALVSILSKNQCKKTRFEAYLNNVNWYFSERDYAERLMKQLDGEIQSDHFGDNPTLSIEGCTLHYHGAPSLSNEESMKKKLSFDFHSHFADFSQQDAATTFEHMCAMLKAHETRNGKIKKNSVFLDNTDGCAKQYRSGNALFLMNVLCMKHHIIIDRAIGAPGHGKSIIDGLNAVDKHYLKKVMCMSGSTRQDDINTRMKMYAFTKDSSLSFAEECARLCALEDRKFGVLSTPQYSNRNHKLNERFYHVQDPNTVQFLGISKSTKGWLSTRSQNGNGIRHHYNFRADPVLGLGLVAARRIPCMCQACSRQLQQPWLMDKEFYDQPRYKGPNKNCILFPELGDLNNWRLISTFDKDSKLSKISSDATKKVFKETLQERSFHVLSQIEIGNYGAIPTTDPKATSGYYVFCFKSSGYILQKGINTNSERIGKGELVCDITWLNPVPQSSLLYSHGYKDNIELDSTIRIQHIVNENIKFSYVTDSHMLSKSIQPLFAELRKKNTIKIDDDCHSMIIEHIIAREHLDFEEYFSSTDIEETSDDDSDNDDNE